MYSWTKATLSLQIISMCTNSEIYNLKARRPYTKVEKMPPVTYRMAFEHG